MKRTGFIFSALACAVCMVCAAAFSSPAASGDPEKLQIVTTIFPEYDWVKKVLGDQAVNAEVTMLLDNGVDLHSFQPTVQDMVAISSCDLFVYVGGESDAWVKDALSGSKNEGRVVVNLMDALAGQIKEEEIVEGMQLEEEDTESASEEDADAKEYDEHIWLSLRNAEAIVRILSEALGEIDPANKESYEMNAESYCGQLKALDKKYGKVVEEGSKDTLLFADRFPFRYMTDDYGLHYYAAFAGCSAETEASFETVLFLTGKVDELGLKVLLTIKGDDQNIARTVQGATSGKDQEILVLDSMQNVNSEDVRNGVTYLDIMKENLEVLRQALE